MSALPDNTVTLDGYTADEIIAPRELHHVTFKTNRINEMVAFYGMLTGHTAMFHGERFAAISFDSANHRIALLGLAEWEEADAEQAANLVGLHHVGYEYETLDQLLHTYLRAKRHGIEPEWTVNHGPTLSFYYRDPDGNGIELQVDNCDHDLDRWMEIIDGPFQQNSMGINVNADKIVDARRRGVTPESIQYDSYRTDENPYAAPGWGPPALKLTPPPGVVLPEAR
jgi:catechol-2,3-dioxygenase